MIAALALLEALATVVQDIPEAVAGVQTLISKIENNNHAPDPEQERVMYAGASAINILARPAQDPELRETQQPTPSPDTRV